MGSKQAANEIYTTTVMENIEDTLQAARARLSQEELELADVEKQMSLNQITVIDKLYCTLQAARARLSREELELADVEKQMEEQLVTEHMQVCFVWQCI